MKIEDKLAVSRASLQAQKEESAGLFKIVKRLLKEIEILKKMTKDKK